MKIEITVPRVGESVSDGVLAEWKRQTGDVVHENEVLFELETDKITLPVTASHSGRLTIIIPSGETVTIGQVVASVETDVQDKEPTGSQEEALQTQKHISTTVEGIETQAPPITLTAGIEQVKAKLHELLSQDILSPAVRRLVDEYHLDPAQIQGTGKDKRITKEDVLKHIASRSKPETATIPQPKEEVQPEIFDTPQSKKVQLETVTIPQPKEEVQPEIADTPQSREVQLETATTPQLKEEVQPEIASALPERQTRKPMSRLRQRIAERLVISQHTAAILTTFNEVDMSAVMNLRARHHEAFQKKYGIKLGIMSFFVKASVEALKAVPEVNAQIDGEDIVYNHYYDIGVAISTDRGLVVPVIRNADNLNFAAIERVIDDYAKQAKERTLTLDNLTGAVFTISNGGVFGSLLSTPILNPPQSGILGMHSIKKRPVVTGENDRIEVRPMMYLALSYDHRLVDGAQAVTFLRRVVECIESPDRIMLGI